MRSGKYKETVADSQRKSQECDGVFFKHRKRVLFASVAGQADVSRTLFYMLK
jgi:hypothetical protein